MPSIKIHEKDVSVTGVENLTTNIVYIPGYSIMGPINEPTLCQTLEEFQSLFGKLPYKFRTSQDFPSGFATEAKVDGKFALAGSYDKSYIYASELLLNGLPVLFERVMKEEEVEKWEYSSELKILNEKTTSTETASTYKLKITSKNPGFYGNSISYKVKVEDGKSILSVTLNKLTEKGQDLGIPETIQEELKISFDELDDNYFERIESSLIDLSLDKTISTTPNKKDSFLAESEGYLHNDASISVDASTLIPKSDEFSLDNLYTLLKGEGDKESIFNKLVDKNMYQFKYLTSGSYPVFEYSDNAITNIMLKVVGERGDALALIDHTNKIDRALVGIDSLKTKIDALGEILVGDINKKEDARKYGTMFTPWATYNTPSLGGNYILPGSFAYLNSLAISVQTNANWYAVAGVTRGLVPNILSLQQNVTGAIANELQKEKGISINPITNIRPYGYCIWGNRTLNKNNGLIASSFLNIRSLANDVKKEVYAAANKLTFELNTDVLWLNFKAAIEPTLDKMISGNGLTSYKIVKKVSNKRATIEAVIQLYAVEAVENFDITVELSDSYVSVQ